MNHTQRAKGSGETLDEAIGNAADELGEGEHTVRVVEISAVVEVQSPGHVKEYRVIVEVP